MRFPNLTGPAYRPQGLIQAAITVFSIPGYRFFIRKPKFTLYYCFVPAIRESTQSPVQASVNAERKTVGRERKNTRLAMRAPVEAEEKIGLR